MINARICINHFFHFVLRMVFSFLHVKAPLEIKVHDSILYIFLALSISSLGNAPALQLSSLEGLSFNLPAEDSQPLLSLKGPGRNDVLVVNE